MGCLRETRGSYDCGWVIFWVTRLPPSLDLLNSVPNCFWIRHPKSSEIRISASFQRESLGLLPQEQLITPSVQQWSRLLEGAWALNHSGDSGARDRSLPVATL